MPGPRLERFLLKLVPRRSLERESDRLYGLVYKHAAFEHHDARLKIVDDEIGDRNFKKYGTRVHLEPRRKPVRLGKPKKGWFG